MHIEKQAPRLESTQRFRNGLAFIPWAQMACDESVFFDDGFLAKRSRGWLANQVYQANARYPGRRFMGRTVDGGARIWRVR